MQTRLIVLLLLGLLQSPIADAGILRGVKRGIMHPVKVVKRIVLLPEYLVIDMACAVSAWYRYEVCER